MASERSKRRDLLALCLINIIENAVSICVIIPQNGKFRAQRYGDKLPKKVGKP